MRASGGPASAGAEPVITPATTSLVSMDLGLRGRVALVVGGTGLIGRAVVEQLRSEGATVVAAARHIDDGITLDAQDSASVTAALEQVVEEHGRLDALVVAAAPSAQTLDASRHADPDQVLTAIDAKAMAFLRLANAALPIMVRAGYGRIVGVSGQNAFLTGNVTGSVRNAALIIAAKNLADGVAGSGVTVNTVSPGTCRRLPQFRGRVGPWRRVEPRADSGPRRFPRVSSFGRGLRGVHRDRSSGAWCDTALITTRATAAMPGQ